MRKQSKVEKSLFKGFSERLMKAIEDEEDKDFPKAIELLRQDRTGPAKETRVPNAGYGKGEISQDTTDRVVTKP